MNLHSLLLPLALVLAGCTTPARIVTPPVVISESTWWQVDTEIVTASQSATEQARVYSRGSMEHWRTLIYERTEANFIPWFSSYWTQEWLSVKVAWYDLSTKAEAANRLAAYLQDQYHDRVLDPVAKEVNPDAITGQATQFYIQLLGQQLPGIAQRNGVPQDQFDKRLQEIPAIALAPPPARSASLYQVVHTDPINQLPAYSAMVEQIHSVGSTGNDSSEAGIPSVAKRTGERLEAQFASRSAAGAAAAVAGRVVGLFISVGVAGVRAILHEQERPEMEAQLRQNLSVAFDTAWLDLVKNPHTGVMAGVNALSGQIEGSLAKTVPQPEEPVIQEQVFIPPDARE
ncbi:MAG: hypothetical protein JWP80_4187 [Pseudomonas sp.]|nr:hypothetical protein [Pseudomonas sp.]